MFCNGSFLCILFIGNVFIGVRFEVEYNWVNLDGFIEYFGWIKGIIVVWNGFKGYLVNFEDGDKEWL